MNNTRIIDKLAMVRLDVSIWGARARLNRSDVKDASALPPQAMATLGSKKLFDPTQLRVFNTLKAKAVRYLDCNGARFLGGWATDENKIADINTALEEIRREFSAAADSFFTGYEDGVRDWASQFPEYSDILLAAVPSLGSLKRKFGFSWQTFKITPIQGDTCEGNDLGGVISNLDQTAMQEVADIIKDIYENTFKDKDKVTRKQFRPFNSLFSKLKALSFIHPYFDGLHTLLFSIVDGYKDKCGDTRFVKALTALLASMSTADGVRTIVEPYNNGIVSATGTLESFAIMRDDEIELLPAVQDEQDMTAVVEDEVVVQAPVEDTVIDNGGLW